MSIKVNNNNTFTKSTQQHMFIDPGMTGGITCLVNGEFTSMQMPTIKVEVKPAVMVLSRSEDGKKQFYSTGKLKGQPKYKVKSPAKYETHIDCQVILNLITQSKAHTLVIEAIGRTINNSAKSSTTTAANWGRIVGIAESQGLTVQIVSPSKWKKDLNLPQDKLPTIELVEELTGQQFSTPRGRLLDGQADSLALAYWHQTKG